MLEQQFEKQLKEIEIQNESLDREAATLLESLQLTPKELRQILSDRAKFSPEEWKVIQRFKHEVQQQIDEKMANARNPQKSEAAQKSLNLPSYALFCR